MNRRGFLIAVSAPIAAVPTSAIAAVGGEVVAPSAVFADLGRKVADASSALHEGRERHARILFEAEAIAPDVPTELVGESGPWARIPSPERRIDDSFRYLPGTPNHARSVITADRLKWQRGKKGLRRLALAYETERRRVQEATGVLLAKQDSQLAEEALQGAVDAALKADPSCFADVLVKAEAMAAAGAIWPNVNMSLAGATHGVQLAQEMARFSPLGGRL